MGELIAIVDQDACVKLWQPDPSKILTVEWELDEDPEVLYHDTRNNLLVTIASRVCAIPMPPI